MSEHQLLELLAQDAPAPSPDLADDVIHRARRVRRRRWAITGTSGAVVAVAALSFAVTGTRTHDAAAPNADNRSPASASHPRPVPPVSTAPTVPDAAIYVAALRNATTNPNVGPVRQVLHVLAHTCDNVIAANVGPCRPQPISVADQRVVAAALAPRVTVRFVTTSDPARVPGGLVTLGRIHLVRGGAQLPIEMQCGPLCGRGATLVLAQHAGAWTVTGTTGKDWIN